MGKHAIMERGGRSNAREIDKSVKNKWDWEWLEKSIDVKGVTYAVHKFLRKLNKPGDALCIVCDTSFSYGGRIKISRSSNRISSPFP